MPALSISHTLRHLSGLLDRSPDPQPAETPAAWHGSGSVVLVGGFCTTELNLEPLRISLARLGYTVTTYTAGVGMGCGRRSVEGLAAAVRTAADAGGAPVRLIGYSRGGQFARVVAADPTEPVRSLITLGTPFDVYGISLPLRLQAATLAIAGTAGIPGLFTLSCFLGSCCNGFHEALRAVPAVPFTAIYSREDQLVRWRACLDPAARTVEVTGSHLGLLVDREPLRAVAEALQRDDALRQVLPVAGPANSAGSVPDLHGRPLDSVVV